MTAQPGLDLHLLYGPQGHRQLGSSTILSYDPPFKEPQRLSTGVGMPWVDSEDLDTNTKSPFTTAIEADKNAGAPWKSGKPLTVDSRQPWVIASKAEASAHSAWGEYLRQLAIEAKAAWLLAHSSDAAASAPWGQYDRQLHFEPVLPWLLAKPADIEESNPWGQYAGRILREISPAWLLSKTVDETRHMPWVRYSRPLDAGWGVVIPPGGIGPDEPSLIIEVKEVYMTVHTLQAQLLPSLEAVVLRDVTIDSNDDGYGWSFSGTGPEHLLDQLAPQSGVPRKIRVTLDGISWVFAVQPPSRTRRFGERRVTVQGSSITALLGGPYLPEQTWLNSNGATAQQLIEQSLQYTGVSVEWGITDWYVPPGVWSFQGTPLAAALRVAEAAGAVLRSHRTDSQLILAPRYPAMPWEWDAAQLDLEMPAAVISTDELRSEARTDFNAVYVSGQSGGVLGHVRRTGTAGDLLAPQVTDSLITHADAARQRGRAALGASGNKLIQTVTMPLLTGGTNPGLVLPGYLVQVNDIHETWRGLVRGISLKASLPRVRQTVVLERRAP